MFIPVNLATDMNEDVEMFLFLDISKKVTESSSNRFNFSSQLRSVQQRVDGGSLDIIIFTARQKDNCVNWIFLWMDAPLLAAFYL